MARKRDGLVRERPEELEALLAGCDEPEIRTRARMLLEMQRAPGLTYATLAQRVGRNERTCRRWWSAYREAGLESLLGRRAADAETRTSYSPREIERESPMISGRFMKFLNSLPVSLDTAECAFRLKACLEGILDGVDRVSIGVDLGCELERPGATRPSVMVASHFAEEGRRTSDAITSAAIRRNPGETFIEQMIDEGFPSDEYWPPHHYDYYLDGREWLGTIVLWRHRHRDPIPQATHAMLRSLEPFMVFLFTDCISRRHRRDPQLKAFQDVVHSIANRIRLTPRQLEVFSLQVLGRSRQQIARQLGIVLGTLDKHIGEIHRKAGTATYTELFARYFRPLGE